MSIEFKAFPKIARLSRMITVTEKIDGTNASIFIGENGEFLTGSRTRWITPDDDNYGFSKWAHKNKDELMELGAGHHFGEWWGQGIQRNYGADKKYFSLFNVSKWESVAARPTCCLSVPVMYEGIFAEDEIRIALNRLEHYGSVAASGFMKPEGVMIYHHAANIYFKKTIEKDHERKGAA